MGSFPFWLPEPGSFPTQPPLIAQRFGPLCLPCTVIRRSLGGSGAVGSRAGEVMDNESGAGNGLCRCWFA